MAKIRPEESVIPILLIAYKAGLIADSDRLQKVDTKDLADMSMLNNLSDFFPRWLVPFNYRRSIDDMSTIAIMVTPECRHSSFSVIEISALEHELIAAKSLAANDCAEIVNVAVKPEKYMSWLTTASDEQLENVRVILQRLDTCFTMTDRDAAVALERVWSEHESRPKSEKVVFGRLICSFQEVLNIVHTDASVRINLPYGWPLE